MIAELTTLREENSELKSNLQKKDVTIESHVIEIEHLQTELRLLRQKMFGPRSERMVVVEPEVQAEIERVAKDRELTGKELLQFRHEHALPLLQEFHNWLKARIGATPPKGLLGTAMNYSLKQWDRLVVYLKDPHVGLDNNAAENAIRPFAVGRKNWLFAGSPAGARASANLYSLVETAQANGLEPYRYLRYIFEKLPFSTTPEDYRKLTPLHLDRNQFDTSLSQWG
ncbi:MAG: transposase [Nitrospirae bacterium]|nr:transposase [Nitrospirota bacterium]